jgi:hypothetical protein
MQRISIIGVAIILTASVLSACGSSGGGSGATAAAVTLSPSKLVALADGNDTVTVRADFTKADGNAADDGMAVTFTVSADGGVLSTATAASANGSASVSVNHAPITGAKNRTLTITASGGGVSGSKSVKFINQPANADVFVALDTAVTNLSGLRFNLNNTTGATFDNDTQLVAAINNAALGNMLIAAGFDAAANSTTIGLAYGGTTGFNTGTDPIVKATYAISSGLPLFSADLTSSATFTAVDQDGNTVVPAVTAANLVVSVTYDTEL